MAPFEHAREVRRIGANLKLAQVREIAIVDDDEDLRMSVVDLVRVLWGVECVALRSYAELVGQAERVLACDLVILDVNLGEGPSGVDAYRWLREHEFRGRVVFLTGHARADPAVEEAYRVGDAQVLEKPVSVAQLGAFVEGSAAP